MKNNYKTRFYTILKKDFRLWDEKSKELNQTLLKDLIDKLDEKLINLLLSDKETREKFFIKVKDVFVLKQNELKFFIDENKLDNSYTQYKNKIGLRVGNKLLSERNEVVLDWPFKDCVLEGGMTKEDQKRNEIFFNEVLAKDEIDRLEDPKAFVNWKRYTAKGEEKVKEIKRDKNGTIKENLIIKGNNLLALHSLKEQFAGKIKLIYIDPPYNTKSDANTFKYNNNFNHSSWLTFMKNRLEVAKELLRGDGIIIIDIDHFELFYLGVLCDEIFGENNRLGILAVQHNPGGRDNEFFANSHENKLVYAKNKSLAKIYNFELTDKELEKYNKEDEISKYSEMGLQRTGDGSKREDRPNLFYPIYFNPKNNEISLEKKNNFIKILPIDDDGIERRWRWSKDKVKKEWESEIIVKKIKNKFKIYTKNRLTKNTGKKAKTFWFDSKYAGTSGTNAIKEIFGDKVFTYPKSPFMVMDTLKISTKPGDIVLDYHLGSGTTAAVAHKMGRQYIGIEQMDYIEDISVERLKKVIHGEQGGISKVVNWRGGGGFIYLELAKWNEEAKEKILKAKNLKELEKLFDELYERYFLNYNVKTKEFKEKTLKEEEFKKLSLDEQKKLFVEMLDMNQMYVNFSERADKKYNLSKEDIALSENFYNKK